VRAPVTAQEALAARIATLARAEPIASEVEIFRAVVQVTGMPSEVVPGDSMDPTHAATATVAPPACDLAVAASVVAAEVSAAVAASVVEVEAEAAEVAAVVAGKCCESVITGARI
jgi:hypothetical protein